MAAVLGADAIPETGWAADAFELTAALSILAKRHRRLVVKMPDSAGGVGNVVLDSAAVGDLDHDRLLAHVWEQTGRAGRGWSFPLLVGAWDDPVVDSPVRPALGAAEEVTASRWWKASSARSSKAPGAPSSAPLPRGSPVSGSSAWPTRR